MRSDDRESGQPDELDLLRREAEALGMPGEITPASLGITLRSPRGILARETSRTAPTNRARRVQRRRTFIRVGAIAAAAGIVAATFAPWQQDTARAGAPPILDYQLAQARDIASAPGEDARAVLLKLSEQASAQSPPVPLGPTQFVLSDNWFANMDAGNATSVLVPIQRESWQRDDGSYRIRETHGRPLGADGRGLAVAGSGVLSGVVNETIPAEGRDPQFVAKLGNDHRKVRASLLKLAGCASRSPGLVRTECLFRQISTVYSGYVIPPKVGAAFWRLLAEEEGLRSLGRVEDRAGRPGIGISFISDTSPDVREVLIVGADTGELLGKEEILIKNSPGYGVKAPAIITFTALLESRYTDERGPSD